MEDQNIIICKVCQKEKVRIKDLDRRRSDRGFKYVDPNGFLFHGRTCPDCHSKAVYRKYEKPAREAAKIAESASSPSEISSEPVSSKVE